MIDKILREIYSKKSKNKAKILSWFFKTGKGEYGEGDKFLGISVPLSRQIAKKYINLNLREILGLLKNKFHEVRLIGLIILVEKYKLAEIEGKKKIFNFYLKNTKYINNWDLVDLSCYHIVGDYLYNFSPELGSVEKEAEKILVKLTESKNLWEQRISMVSTFYFIKKGKLDITLKIAKIYLNHKHDLIHKATGWMLREVGKKNEKILLKFLNENNKKMPRTMLRYSIEKLSLKLRTKYMKK